MSQEWLKQLAELSNDKELRKRAQKLEKAQRTTVRPAAGRQRGLVGAVFGHFFRWLFLFGLAEAAVMFVVADNQGLTNESWGYIFHYVVWYALTQPVFPAEAYAALQDWFGLTPAALSAFYDQVNPILQAQQDALVFYVPAGASLALTLFFLPVINAGRRRSPIRLLILIANLAVIGLYKQLNDAVIALWLGAFLFSFIGGGGQRAPRQAKPKPPVATPQARPASQPQPQRAARPESAAAQLSRPSVVDRASRAATALNKREPAVVRHGTGSWVRGR
jgi:hypothetical protein